MKVFSRKTEDMFPLPPKVVAAIFGVGGAYGLSQGHLFGVWFLIPALLVFFANKGFILDLDTHRYKEYSGALGLKWGKWKPLPPIMRITMTKDTVVYRNQSYRTGLSTYSNSAATALNFRINDRIFLRVARGSYNSILKDALYLSERLNLEVLDATSPEKKIINSRG